MKRAGVKVKLKTDFSVIKETLSRIGIVNQEQKRITPTAYLHCVNDKCYIYHFKELLSMFEKRIEHLDEKDENRRNGICSMLVNWDLIEIEEENIYQDPLKEKIFVLPYKEKFNYYVNNKFKSFHLLNEIDI